LCREFTGRYYKYDKICIDFVYVFVTDPGDLTNASVFNNFVTNSKQGDTREQSFCWDPHCLLDKQ